MKINSLLLFFIGFGFILNLVNSEPERPEGRLDDIVGPQTIPPDNQGMQMGPQGIQVETGRTTNQHESKCHCFSKICGCCEIFTILPDCFKYMKFNLLGTCCK
ncbi:hypothetical protein ACQ4LE_000650 [Meloidogyne hapla]|uniref:Uncharacterized protein n=1 Tax=Meloidogyne hapla TaxID=6305 RepID=A0A1I8B271_MELHA